MRSKMTEKSEFAVLRFPSSRTAIPVTSVYKRLLGSDIGGIYRESMGCENDKSMMIRKGKVRSKRIEIVLTSMQMVNHSF